MPDSRPPICARGAQPTRSPATATGGGCPDQELASHSRAGSQPSPAFYNGSRGGAPTRRSKFLCCCRGLPAGAPARHAPRGGQPLGGGAGSRAGWLAERLRPQPFTARLWLATPSLADAPGERQPRALEKLMRRQRRAGGGAQGLGGARHDYARRAGAEGSLQSRGGRAGQAINALALVAECVQGAAAPPRRAAEGE